jgi:predicted dehydrogenase
MKKIAMLGTGLIGTFYTMTLMGMRSKDIVHIVAASKEDNAKRFAEQWNIPRWTDSIDKAINDPEVDLIVIGLPNHLHKEAVFLAAKAKKPVLCTKPLGRNAQEAFEMLEAVEKAGIFAGYLEDLVYTPKSLKAINSVKSGTLGKVLWTRSREAHSGPHSDWFWKKEYSGGGAIIDMGCHCIEIGRNFIGKNVRPVEVTCWADTLVHPIEAEDNAIGLVKYENGAVSQFEVSWTFRGGMDLRDEVSGTEGTIWLNHWLRTGFETFTSGTGGSYVSEKTETDSGWLFPVGDEVHALGYAHMFLDMLSALENGSAPMETFYDGYVVNEIMDACYRSITSKKWETINLKVWRGEDISEKDHTLISFDEDHFLIKEEKMPDGKRKIILKDKKNGDISQLIKE